MTSTTIPSQASIQDTNEQRMIDGIRVSLHYASEQDAPVSDTEIRAYIERGNVRHLNSTVSGLVLEVDGDEVGIHYELAPLPFDRIRRITGYLVGTMDRWNNAKTTEEHDRVKHTVACDERAFACSNGC